MKIESMDDVARIVMHGFPEEAKRAEARRVLSRYGLQSFHPELPRVWAACLKVADGQLDRLEETVAIACRDYRDMLCLAECPEQTAQPELRESDPAKYAQLAESDRLQYAGWVARMKRMPEASAEGSSFP
ncbi:MAG: hypothetical protein AAGC73_00990 [Verrucomicrobiota bacterium]